MDDNKKRKNSSGLIFKIIAIIIFTICIITIITNITGKGKKKIVIRENEIVEIYSVDLETNGKGSFVLGCGNYEDEPYYYVYQATDDSGKKLQRYHYDYVTIYDNLEADEQPYMDITYSWDVKMYLPKDSIIQKYDVNLK
ncbi:MAG: hypothetical protein K2F60_05220 [Oscillospiraceae bacterium]|nr:hypothetical protein [Oscillospiraceae bacterium]